MKFAGHARLAGLAAAWLGGWSTAHAQTGDLPAGFIVRAAQTRLLPAGTHLERAAVAGDILFPGDQVSAAGGTVVLDYCPGSSQGEKLEITASSQFSIPRQGRIDISLPSVQSSPAEPCELPAFEREPEVATIRSIRELAPREVPPGTLISHIQALAPAAQTALLTLALGDLTKPRVRLALAVELERQGLWDEAIDQYARLATLWPDQPRIPRYMERLRARPAARSIRQPESGPAASAASAAAPYGRIHALVIGISKYEQKEIRDLSFADRDAAAFAAYLRTPRGGLGDQDRLDILLNSEATTAEIRNRMNALKSGAGRDDTAVVFAAGHGDMWQGVPRLIAHRADPQYIGISAYPMKQFQQLLDGQSAPWGRALIFLDICHSGHLAQFQVASRSLVPNYLMMMAANPMTVSKGKPPVANAYEDAVFGGGHGAFTYFLLRGLNTREAKLSDGELVSAPELKLYVESKVAQATSLQQNPATVFNMGKEAGLADLRLPGLPGPYPDLAQQLRLASARLRSAARNRGAPLPSGPLMPLEGSPPEPELQARIRLEEQGDEILLRYLRGEEEPLTRDDFARGEALFRQALALQPGSPYLRARAEFCEGRKLVFDKNYPESAEHLERSIRLDPGAAYAYNALGIRYLEEARFDLAANAFRDATERAPAWAYPLHNLALVQLQAGDYEGAIASYRKAMQLAPKYYYLPYNLGLLYQKINRVDEARQAYEKAKSLTDTKATPDIALGLLFANSGRERGAKESYDRALELLRQFPDPLNLAIARHNKAALLARHSRTRGEAVRLWTENIATANYLPSRVSLAELLSGLAERRGRGWEQSAANAISQYVSILEAEPEYLAARVQAAFLLQELGRGREALPLLLEAARRNPESAAVAEKLGDLQKTLGMTDAARASWRKASELSASKEVRGRLEKKLRQGR